MKSTGTFRYGAHVLANGIRQHYLRYGGAEAGPPLILVPGITSPAATWGFVGERFGRTFDTYVLDVRGRGLSASGPDLDYSLDTCAKDVVALAQALRLQPYLLVGHSLGGRIAIRAARIDRQIEKLVIVDAPLSGPGRPPYPSPLDRYLTAIRLARRGASLEELRPFTPTWTEEHLRVRAEWLHTCDETAITQSHHGLQTDDIHADLAAVQQKVLFIVAGKGPLSAEAIDEVRRIAPAVLIRVVPNAGHMIPMEDIEGFMAAFDDFLGKRLDG
jgi:N-formylmaleamate deformylase